jgi:hypothetical protein
VSGQSNWGIPKQFANVSIENQGKKIEVEASLKGRSFFSAMVSKGRISFPVTTKLIPIPLHQKWKDKYYFTQFIGSGCGSFSRLSISDIDEEKFVDTHKFRSLATIAVDPFKLTFPLARIKHHDLTIL